MKGLFHNEKGAATVVVALLLVVVAGFSAIVVDYGNMAGQRRSLQNAVDAASLAAAQSLPFDTADADSLAEEYMDINGGYLDLDVTYSNNNTKVTVSASRRVDYIFARVLFSESGTEVSARAAAEITSVFGPFDYALFSGSEIDLLQFTGTNYISGDVHANYNIKNSATVDGTVTAVGTIDGKITATGGKVPGTDVLALPDFSNVVDLAKVMNSTALLAAGAEYKKGTYTMSPDELNALLAAESGDPIFIDGNLEINGTGVAGTGCIIVTGNITFNGGDVDMDSNDAVCLASLHGDITFNGGDGDVTGILFAPEGTVTMNGKSGVLKGSIIAEVIDSNGGLTIYFDSKAQNSVPLTEIHLIE